MANEQSSSVELTTERPAATLSESEGGIWVDPVFEEQAPPKLPDEIALDAVEAAGGDDREALEALAKDMGDNPPDPADTEDAESGQSDEAPDGDEDGDEEGGTSESQPKLKKESRRERRRRRQAEYARQVELENARLKGELAALKAGTASAGAPAEDGQDATEQDFGPAPKLSDFDYDADEWAAAYSAWNDKKLAALEDRLGVSPRSQEQQRQAAQQSESAAAWAKFTERQEEAMDRYEDYEEVVLTQDAIIPPIAADVIVGSEVGPDIAYYLAKNPDEAIKIRDTSPQRALMMLGQIEAKVQAGAQFTAPGQSDTNEPALSVAEDGSRPSNPRSRRKQTAAPAPAPTVRGSTAGGRDPSKMSMAEYEAMREKQGVS